MSFSEFRLHLLGHFELLRAREAAPIRLSGKKAGALLAIVALSPGQIASRDRLAGLLWGGRPDNLARQSLRQTLVRLRKELPSSTLFEVGNDAIRFLPGQVSTDLLELRALSTSTDLEDLRRAQELAKGEFLAGLDLGEEGFQEWLDEQRRDAEVLSGRVFEAYCLASDRIGDGNEALLSVDRLLRLDPLREDWQRLALHIYARYRGHNEAIARAKIFEDSLKRELNVSPEPQTLALLETIRRAGADHSSPAFVPPAEDPVAASKVRMISPPASVGLTKKSPIMPMGRNFVSSAAALLFISILPTLAYFYAVPPSSRQMAAVDPNQAMNDASWQSPSALQSKSRSASRVIAVAVLPFITYGNRDSSTELIADMMSDDLINSLARVPALRVISRQTTRAYRGKSIDVAKIAGELGVRYVLEGSLRQDNDSIRVNVELIDPQTRQPVWSERISRAGQDRTQIHEEIVNRLSRELQFEVYQAVAKKTANPTDVLELTYKGFTAIIASSNQGKPALDEAKAYFDKALKIVPDSGEAHRGIAMYHVLLVAHFLTSDRVSHLAEAERILRRQLRDDPNQSNAQYFMGLLHELREEREEATAAFQRAVEINPSYALAYAEMGHVLITQGQSEQALELIHYAIRLSPRDPHRSVWLRFAGEAELELGRYREATSHLTEAADLSPNNPPSLRALIAVHALSGNPDEARRLLDRLRMVAPHLTEERLLSRPSRFQPKLAEGLKVAFGPRTRFSP